MTSAYGWNRGDGGVFHYRIAEPLRGLSLHGWDTATGPEMTDEIADRYHVIVAHSLHDEVNSEAWRKLWRRGKNLLVMDVDDDVWRFDRHTEGFRYWSPARLDRLTTNIRCADVVTTPSMVLAEKLLTINPNVWVLGNYVPEYVLGIPVPVPPPHRFTFGFQGARQHTIDLRLIDNAMWHILRRQRRARVHLWGELDPIGWPPGRVIRTLWQTDMDVYYRSLSMNVGIAPLADTPFNRHKSALRAVEYAALGIPILASELPPYIGTVQHERTGWLVKDHEWLDLMEHVIKTPSTLQLMRYNARQAATAWTTELNAQRWVRAYSE